MMELMQLGLALQFLCVAHPAAEHWLVVFTAAAGACRALTFSGTAALGAAGLLAYVSAMWCGFVCGGVGDGGNVLADAAHHRRQS